MNQQPNKTEEDGKQSNQSARTILTVVMSWLIVSSLFFSIESWSTTAKFSDTGLPTLVAIHAFIAVFKLLLLLYGIYGLIAIINGNETMIEVLFYMTLVISMIGFIVLLGTTIPCSIDAARCDYKSHFSNISAGSFGDILTALKSARDALESSGAIEQGSRAQISPAIIKSIIDGAKNDSIAPIIVGAGKTLIDQLMAFRARTTKEKEQWRNVQENFQCCVIHEPELRILPKSIRNVDCPAKGRDWFMFVLARNYEGCLKLAEFRDQDGRYSLLCDLITLVVLISSVLFYHLKNNRN